MPRKEGEPVKGRPVGRPAKSTWVGSELDTAVHKIAMVVLQEHGFDVTEDLQSNLDWLNDWLDESSPDFQTR